MSTKIQNNDQSGSIIVSILVVTIFITSIVYSLMILANSNIVRGRNRILLLQAQYAAESGADVAIAQLNANNTSYTGTGGEVIILSTSLYKSTFSVSVAAGSTGKEKVITAVGKVYSPANSATASQTRRIEVTAQRSSSTTSSSLVSRNIIDVDSGVKNIQSKDVFVNGYINMNKNTTNLIAENITVADKNTGASNCSIGGSGNLLKPSSFTTAGQTKTKITTAYNNCISPPGNSSNANFDVYANQSTISKIQSTLIPWTQSMDASYQSSPTGCTDWTSGAFPRDIPSTGNTKKTHYPDSGSNIDTACGTSGNLQLATGQYNIKDHVHVRANFCSTTACTPTFNNPDATIKFVFIEGSINFDNVITASTSGPIVFISYGTDPASKTSVCPLGGSIYIGKASGSEEINAPDAYFLATNGVCINQAKFGASPALGGLSGKNIYISSNSGTPFDLKLDPIFPTDQIPVDLSWRAIRYRRL